MPAKRSASKSLINSALGATNRCRELRRDEVVGHKAAELSTVLFPNKNLQEREIAGASFLARHGIDPHWKCTRPADFLSRHRLLILMIRLIRQADCVIIA